MYVTCPACQSLYTLNAEHLRLAGGRVRCSACQTVFDARIAVFDDPRQAHDFQHSSAPASVVESAGPAPIDDAVVSEEIVLAGPVDDDVGKPGAVAVPQAGADCYAHPVAAEFVTRSGDNEADQHLSAAFLYDEQQLAARTSWGALVAAFLLTFILILQYAYVERYRLSQFASFRPYLQWGCQFVSCNLPLPHDLSQVEMIEREVRDHPRVKDALLIHARFINRARFAQAYPVLQVAFSDMSGTPIAVRRFGPDEYLSHGNIAQGMQPGETALVMLEVVDPGEAAVSFQFDFM